MRMLMLIGVAVAMPVAVAMIVMTAAAQQPGAGNVDGKAKAGDGDSLGEMDGHGRIEARDGFIADQHGDHGQDDGAGEAGEIAELAGAEGEARVGGMPARIGVGKCGKQQRAGMRAHMQPVGDERDRTEQEAADDLGHHHGRAEPDHRPGLALALAVLLAQEHMAVEGGCAHDGTHFT